LWQPSNVNFELKIYAFSAQLKAKMLIRFSVSNYRSCLETQTLSMAASRALKNLRQKNTFSTGLTEKGMPDLLSAAAIYGPNASGKSNLVKALAFVQHLVLESALAPAEAPLSLQPFRLNPTATQQDSQFEIEFIESGIRYQFGLTANTQRITSEWLIAYPKSRPHLYFERTYKPAAGKDDYVFGNQFEGGRLRRDWAQQTGPNTLYFSRAVQRSAEEFKQLRAPYAWFSRRLRILGAGEHHVGHGYTIAQCEGEKKQKILDFLNAADVPIADLCVEKHPFDRGVLPSNMPKAFKDEIIKQFSDKEIAELRFYHHAANPKELIEFKEEDESDGTRSLFALAGPWIDVLENHRVLIVDELDASLHPLIVQHLIQHISQHSGQAQLIFTTHDTSVMASRLLRRDQIWFTERDAQGATHLYALQNFKGREDDAIEHRYLSGRYGGLPILGSLWRQQQTHAD